nr:hypothetical protein CFP56_04736 [Quercus suber]
MFHLASVIVYDPITEFLNYTDNCDFSVNGALADFPIPPLDDLFLEPSSKLFCTGHCRGQGTLEAEEVTLAAEDFFYDVFEDPEKF